MKICPRVSDRLTVTTHPKFWSMAGYLVRPQLDPPLFHSRLGVAASNSLSTRKKVQHHSEKGNIASAERYCNKLWFNYE